MIVASRFRAPQGLRSPHLQTIWPVLFRRQPPPPLHRERLELPDGDFLDLDWTPERDGPITVVFHGLEGSIRSHYASAIMRALLGAGRHAVLAHFRGCSGEPNRLSRGYNAGDTADLATVVDRVRQRYPGRPVAAIGYSLGGNALLKWLGERGDSHPLARAVAVSVPFRLAECAERIRHGASRLYMNYLMRKMRDSVRRKQDQRGLNLDLPPLESLRDFFDFDDKITAPLHGYDGVDDYYARASCRGYLTGISRQTLILHALDDPFMYPTTVPQADELSAAVRLELSEHGGHVGFVDRPFAMRRTGWLERRILDWLDTDLPASVEPEGLPEHGHID